MDYISNPNVPSILKEQYRKGLLSKEEFEKQAESDLNDLAEAEYFSEQADKDQNNLYEDTRGVK